MNNTEKFSLATTCHICEGTFDKTYVFTEKMFGFNDEFKYNECASCGCLQIAAFPANIEKYYPPYYYSFTQEIPGLKRLPLIKRIFGARRLRKRYKRNLDVLKYLKEIDAKITDRILDVGCGKGLLICELFNQGFEKVEGVDKFLPQAINYKYGVKVQKKELEELSPNYYNLIMMNHVLEHMAEQEQSLAACYKLLKDDGCLMVRIPLLGEAWERYSGNWVQLDAPRHFFLHTLKSINILAQKTGFEIRKTMFDSTNFQFLGSELYERGIPLFSESDDYNLYPFNKIFNPEQIQEFDKMAEDLNREQRGDSGVFYLYKKKSI